MANHRAGILGTGHAYPEGILSNADLAAMVETSDDWITTRTGIKQRRKAAPDEYTSQFAVRAARQAIERAELNPSDIDLLFAQQLLRIRFFLLPVASFRLNSEQQRGSDGRRCGLLRFSLRTLHWRIR